MISGSSLHTFAEPTRRLLMLAWSESIVSVHTIAYMVATTIVVSIFMVSPLQTELEDPSMLLFGGTVKR